MTVKSILCIFDGSEGELNALNTALILAKTHAARLRILHISSEPSSYAGIYGEAIIASATIIEAIEKENAARLAKAHGYAASFCASHHVPLDGEGTPAHHASARFVHLSGMMDTLISSEGRLSDLIVIGHDLAAVHDFITPALFHTGRPVLMMPPQRGAMPQEWQDKTVVVAWNGSKQSARALYNALPLIRNAEKLMVLCADLPDADLAGKAALMEYLRDHGIEAQIILVAAGSRTAGEALLARARELQADMLVMGAYGHTMLREMILGGVTEHMLRRADIPLLMSH